VVFFETCPDYKPFSRLQKRHMTPDIHDIDHVFLISAGVSMHHNALRPSEIEARSNLETALQSTKLLNLSIVCPFAASNHDILGSISDHKPGTHFATVATIDLSLG
jgi:hypothetical protein